MRTDCKNVAFSSWFICTVFFTFVVGQDDLDVSSSGQLRTRMRTADRHADGSVCRCPPCMTGTDCSENVTSMQPRFSSKFTFVEVNTEHHRHGVPLKYNHTTYPADAYCPCNAFEYAILSVENEMKPDDPGRFGLFKINRKTGIIRLAENRISDITASDLYHLIISVRNIFEDISDQTNITVAPEKSPEQNQFSLSTGNGYEELNENEKHVIHKRAVVIPSEVNLTLSQTNTVTEVRVGTRVTFQLDIVFPLTPTDISVELFTPDNETTVMILCDVKIEHIGGNLGMTLSGEPTFLAKDGWDVNSAPDMAVLDFGVVTNNGSDTANIDASTITISYTAVMIDNTLTTNGSTYWVSAGAEYENEQKIWVGQALYQFINDGNQDVSLEPEFNVSMPTNIALGSSLAVSVEMFIPYPSRTYTFKVFTPADTIGVMSICAIWFEGFGQNFGCGNNVNKILNSTERDPQAVGNAIGIIDFGTLLNKASRDDSIVVQDNKVALTFIVHMYPDETRVSQLLSLGLSLEIDTDTMLIGSSNFTVDPEVTVGLTDPEFINVTSSLNSAMSDATVGQPFSLTYDLKVPFPVTEGVASHYILELLAPFDGTPIFSVCSFEVIYVGQDLPCIKTDELVTEYSSRVPDSSSKEPDRATIDLGFVTKFNITGNDDDMIQVRAILQPLASHSSAVASSTHTVSLAVQVGSNSVSLTDVSITIATEEIITPVTNDTAPAFTMAFFDADDNVPVTGSTKVIMNMTTSRNISYDAMDMEFLMPTSTEYSYFHLCRVDIVSSGKNMPCLTPEWYRDHIEYSSQFNNYEIDRARLATGKMCNYQFEDDVSEDVTSFAFYLKVLNRPDLLASQWLSMGLQYSSNNIWIGQLKLFATTGVSVTHTKSVYVASSRNTTTSPTPIGHTVSYSLLIKIGRGDTAHLVVKATAQSEGAHICTVRVVAAGANLPCVVDEVATRTYTLWPSGSGRKDVELDLGFVTNFGDYNGTKTANNFFDVDSIIVEVLVRANPAQPAGTYPIDVKIYFNSARTAVSSVTKTDFVTTEALPGDTSIPNPVNVTFTVGEITGGLDNSTEIAIGEAKRVLITAVIPEGTNYDLEFTFIIPSEDVGKIEICDAAIVSVGDNLPCIDILTEAVKTASLGLFIDTATFNLGYTCNRPIRPGDTKANTVVFEAYIRALRNDFTFVGDIVTVTASMRTFLSQVDVDLIDFTVTDPSLFVDRVMSLDQVTNETLISLDAANPLVLGISQNWTVKANISVPKHSVSKFLFDVELPTSDSACLTVNEIRVIGSVGRNILCIEPDVNSKSIVHAPQYNSTRGTSQRNYVFLDLGIVTNTGLTYRRNAFTAGDDDVQIEFDIQMADCSISDNGAVFKLSIGNKVADYAFIYEHDVQVFRDGNEKPDINLIMNVGAASTSTTIYAEGTVFHSNTSTAEGRNTSVFVAIPAYQLAPGSLIESSNHTCTLVPITDYTAVLQIFCENFFFSDVLTFTAEIQLNNSVVLPVGFSGADSIAQAWVGTYYVSRFNTFDNEDWFPYPVSGQNELQFEVDGGIDRSELFALGLEDAGIVSDCQITSSLGDIVPSTLARLNSAGAWSPFVRYANFAANRYLVVYLGNLHKFMKMAVQQDTGSIDLVTEVAVEYTNDGGSWFGGETISISPSPSTLENVTLSGIKARGVRISLTNDTAFGNFADVGVSFELYGIQLTTDATQADACNALAGTQLSVPIGYPPFGPRSFVVDTISNTVYVCDRYVESKVYVGRCTTSSDLGNSWEKLDQRLECMIGYETSQSRLYAYARDRKIMMREANGLWQNVPLSAYEEDRLLLTWTNAIIVPEQATAELNRITPHASYRISTWGVTMKEVFESNVMKSKWAAT